MRLPSPLLMIRLAAADLRCRWMMNLCLMLALAGVVAPLLLLLGLKNGIILGLLDPMRKNPAYRELVSEPGRAVPGAVLAEVERHPKLAITIRRPSASLAAVVVEGVEPRGGAAGGARDAGGRVLDLEASEGDDPLLLENGIRRLPADFPEEGFTTVALSPAAVDALGLAKGVAEGDTLLVRVTRVENRRITGVPWKFKVSGIATPRIGDRARVFVPLSFALDVEAYKGGREVKARGWPSGPPQVELPLCSGALLLLQTGDAAWGDAADPAFLREIVGLPAWGEPAPLEAGELAAWAPLGVRDSLPDNTRAFLLRAAGDTGIGLRDWDDLREFLRQRGCETLAPAAATVGGLRGSLLPWVAPRAMRLRYEMASASDAGPPPDSADKNKDALPALPAKGRLAVEVAGLSGELAAFAALGLDPPPAWPLWAPWAGESAAGADAPPPDRRILLPAEFGGRMPACWLEVVDGDGAVLIEVPVEPVQSSGIPGRAVVAAELAGILRRAADAPIRFDYESGHFFRQRSGFAGFRSYAHKLEDVVELEREIGSLAPVSSQAREIGKVLELKRHLVWIFNLITLVVGWGAAWAMAFSLVAWVERKHADSSFMRLVEGDRSILVLVPVVQTSVVCAGAFLIAWKGITALAADLINTRMGPFVRFGEEAALCNLPDPLAWQGLALTVLAGCVVVLATSLTHLGTPQRMGNSPTPPHA